MDSIFTLNEQILRNFGGTQSNSLTHIVQEEHSDIDDSCRFVQSNYYTHDDFVTTAANFMEHFSVLTLNCQSLNAKFDSLTLLIEELREQNFQFSAICLQETWLDNDTDLSLFQIENYTLIAQGRHCCQHGGLIIYLLNKFRYNKINLNVKSDIWEGLFFTIMNSNKCGKSILLGNIYRPPKDNNSNTNVQKFLEEISQTISELNISNPNVIFVGDFNIDLLKIKQHRLFNEFLDTLVSLNLHPKITYPTRFSENNGTLIDNIFSNIPSTPENISGIILSNIPDHLPCFLLFQTNLSFSKPSKYIFYYIQNDNILNDIFHQIQSSNLIEKMEKSPTANPNINYNKIEKLIKTAVEQHAPLKKQTFHKHKHKKTKWITNGIIQSIRFRDKLYKNLKLSTPNTVNFFTIKQNLKTYNLILKKLIKEAKELYYKSEFAKHKNDSKKTWDIINNIIKKKAASSFPEYIKHNDHKISDLNLVTNHFNEYFNSIGSSLAATINNTNKYNFTSYLTDKTDDTFSFNTINDKTVLEIIQNFRTKNRSGHDRISSKLLKHLAPILAKPLSLTINQSLNTGIFPDQLKIAKILPIHKKDSPHLLENYRPISLLLVISKIFEKVVFDQLTAFFMANKLFFPSQYGFRKHHSTEYAALELIDRIMLEMEKGNNPLTVFLDLSKAFDTLNHEILLHKLKYYGIKKRLFKLVSKLSHKSFSLCRNK